MRLTDSTVVRQLMKTPPPSLEYCLLQVKMYAAKVALATDTVRLDIDLVALAKWTKKARHSLVGSV